MRQRRRTLAAVGKEMFELLQCQQCHVLGAIPKDQPTSNLAPDLRMVPEYWCWRPPTTPGTALMSLAARLTMRTISARDVPGGPSQPTSRLRSLTAGSEARVVDLGQEGPARAKARIAAAAIAGTGSASIQARERS